ncbi:MAG: cholesterol oxidase, partial [Solirubrobacteraceae bacterium]|nr:cholesterol oxidase [Solirubrobacteraceae bacterium]
MGGVGFTEEMAGWVSFEETDFNQALHAGRRARRTALVHLRIDIDDLDRFIADPDHRASAAGWLECGELGGRLPIDDGRFELFVETPDALHLRMRYRLFARTPAGGELTLVGFKLVENDLGSDHWADQTTLFTRVYAGRVEADPPGGELGPGLIATGVLRISIRAFMRQLTTYRATAPTRGGRLRDVARFQAFFLAKLMLAYAAAPVHGLPSFPADLPPPPPPPEWEPVLGRPGLARRVVPHTTDDGVALKLDHLRREDLPPPTRGPVLVSHGAGLRGQMYYAQPSGWTLVDALLEAGYDVWVQHWRGSIDLPTVSWTLDEVARYDHPAAVRTILAQTGSPTLKAVVHCQGSVSFTMAAAAGLLPEVTEVVATGVSLHIRVPREAAEKHVMVPTLARLTPWIDAQWAVRPITLQGRLLARLGAMSPFEQRVAGVLMHRLAAHVNRRSNPAPAHPAQTPAPAVHPGYRGAAGPEHPVGRMANFMYGAGADVLWRGDNVTREIHEWMGRELGSSPLSLFGQIRAS